jgi:anti-sigma regulatory factor (Ser/Thr protein kinase)
VNRLHFHPIRGKALDIIDVILHTEEVMSVGEAYGVIRLVTEELVVNIADYAYPDGVNDFLDVEIERDEKYITLRFRDGGVPFNPLEQPPPDISLPMEQRRIGGMGLLIVMKKMDAVAYEYTDDKNVLTVMKKL